jgi:hypothetical protein
MGKDQIRNYMSSRRKFTRHKIGSREIPDFIFLGIVSSEPDYRLSVMLNRHLGIDLRHSQTDISDETGPSDQRYSRFTTNPVTLSLVSNRNQGKSLIRKLKNIDYLLILHGPPDRKQAEALAASVRRSSEVTAVFVFESKEINDSNLSLLGQL